MTSGAPPGIDPRAFARALVEDTADLLGELAHCESAVVACPPSYAAELRPVLWPGTPLVTIEPGDSAAMTLAALAALHELGADEAVIVAADAPDLPGLLVGKLFSALTTADASICPAADGLVALGARLPVAAWVAGAGVGLDTTDAHGRLAGAAPQPSALVVASGWHRLRTPADIGALDYGLEGWEATRALLGGY
jgi:hypothetical protein